MSRLDWCKNILLSHGCYNWEVDKCDGCNIFRAFCKGAEQAKLKWIPVSEKPEPKEKTYLIQTDGGYVCSCRWTNVNHFWTDLTTDWHWNIHDIPQYSKVVAWMEKPGPYREEGEA